MSPSRPALRCRSSSFLLRAGPRIQPCVDYSANDPSREGAEAAVNPGPGRTPRDEACSPQKHKPSLTHAHLLALEQKRLRTQEQQQDINLSHKSTFSTQQEEKGSMKRWNTNNTCGQPDHRYRKHTNKRNLQNLHTHESRRTQIKGRWWELQTTTNMGNIEVISPIIQGRAKLVTVWNRKVLTNVTTSGKFGKLVSTTNVSKHK